MNEQIESIKFRIKEVWSKLPKDAKVKYLPLTKQVLIYGKKSEGFNENNIKKIGEEFGNYETNLIRHGKSSTCFMLINHFNNDNNDNNNRENDSLALKTLVTYALEREKYDRQFKISMSLHHAYQEEYYDGIERPKNLEKNLKEDYSHISSNCLIDQVKILKGENKQGQRELLYDILDTLADCGIFPELIKGEVTAGAIEVLLEKLPNIDEEKIDFDLIQKTKIDYPKDIDLSTSRSLSLSQLIGSTSKNLYSSTSASEILKKQEEEHSLIKISELDYQTVEEFNRIYEGKYSIKKEKKEPWKDSWVAKEYNRALCGVFDITNNILTESSFSKNHFDFILTVQKWVAQSNHGYR